MKTILCYQAYGQDYILKQNLFSILSLFRRASSLEDIEKVLIYTDRRDFFENYLGGQALIEYQPMDPGRLKSWRGDIDFVHRVKVEMLKNVSNLYPGRNIFYFDGDTYFVKDPKALLRLVDSNHSVMHEAEGVIDQGRDPLSKKIARFLSRTEFQISDQLVKIPTGTTMWNAGVLGFAPNLAKELENVLQFTDQAYGKYQKHVMEQLGFSYFLAARTRILPADHIHHYWRQKEQYNKLISDFIERTQNFSVGLSEYDQIQWPGPPLPKKSLWQKFWHQIKS